MKTLSDNTRGALLMMGSMAAFSFGDACIKAMGGQIPLSQLLVLRGILASTFLFVLAWRMDALRFRLPRRDWALVVLRSVAEVGAAYFFITALFNMPFANVSALLQLLPLTVTLGSALVFREAVGWRRWTAIAVGFSGMLLIVKPGTEGFNAYTLIALASVACITVRDLATRRMSSAVPSLMVTLCGAVMVLLFAGVLSFGQDWVALTPRLAALIGAAAVFVIGGYLFSVLVMRVGDVAVVAPFRYTALVWALLLGFLFFGEWPGPLTMVGAAIVVATGLYTLWRETRVARRRKTPVPGR